MLWITGHSRGGALANVLAAKRIDAGYNVYAYTFAAAATTTSSTAAATKYNSIFNIINTDDLVPQLPMSDWNFKRYGVDKPASIETSYASQWDSLIYGNLTYTSNKTSMENTVDALSGIADNRNQCYEYKTGITAYYTDCTYPTYESAALAANAVVEGYPANTIGTYYWVRTGSAQFYGYAMYQKPAFLMQLMAATMAKNISGEAFALTMTATYLWSPKGTLTSFVNDGYTEHPHFLESYYLLSTKITS